MSLTSSARHQLWHLLDRLTLGPRALTNAEQAARDGRSSQPIQCGGRVLTDDAEHMGPPRERMVSGGGDADAEGAPEL